MTEVLTFIGTGPLADPFSGSRAILPQGFANKTTGKIHLVQAQLATLHSAPVTLIPAPGAGKMIMPVDYYVLYHFVTTQYNALEQFAIGDTQEVTYPQVIGGAQDQFQIQSFVGWGDRFSVTVNQPLTLLSSADDTNGGDGTLDLWINYFVIDTSGNIQP